MGLLAAIQPLLDAARISCASLVQDVAASLGMIFRRTLRDRHTKHAHEALSPGEAATRRHKLVRDFRSRLGASGMTLLVCPT